MKMWNAAIYLRLSREDGDFGESISIQNQKSFIENWVSNVNRTNDDIKIIDSYVDDGYTGTNFERPSFKRMIRDVDKEKINCIIVKDLSRLGRNYSKVSYYIDELFPVKKIRFIAINDSLDTQGLIDENDATGFKLVCNEFYVKDISKKVKSAFRALASRGEYIGTVAPYGYIKQEDDVHKLVIDEEVAETVRWIFKEYINGSSCRKIANELNEKNVLSPHNYHLLQRNKEIDESKVWNSTSVNQILHNEVYFGNLVQHKREKVSYKLQKRRVTDKSEYIICENTHEPIIGLAAQKLVRERFKKNGKKNVRETKSKQVVPVLFSGLLRCADCGSKMAATLKRNKRCYRCYKYNSSGSSACTSHLIYEKDIVEVVNENIKTILADYKLNNNAFINNIINKLYFENEQLYKEKSKNKLKITEEIDKIKEAMYVLYQDKINKEISGEMFTMISQKYDSELQEKLKELDEYNTFTSKYNCDKDNIIEWINNMLEFDNLSEPTFEFYHSVIDTITVKDIGEENRITIKYKIGYIDNEIGTSLLKIA